MTMRSCQTPCMREGVKSDKKGLTRIWVPIYLHRPQNIYKLNPSLHDFFLSFPFLLFSFMSWLELRQKSREMKNPDLVEGVGKQKNRRNKLKSIQKYLMGAANTTINNFGPNVDHNTCGIQNDFVVLFKPSIQVCLSRSSRMILNCLASRHKLTRSCVTGLRSGENLHQQNVFFLRQQKGPKPEWHSNKNIYFDDFSPPRGKEGLVSTTLLIFLLAPPWGYEE